MLRRGLLRTPGLRRGLEDFLDKARPGEPLYVGRQWTAAELRRKSFDDLHKLWYVLYKERNMLLSEKERAQARQTQMLGPERLVRVKRSMAAIKFVLGERKRLQALIGTPLEGSQQQQGEQGGSSA